MFDFVIVYCEYLRRTYRLTLESFSDILGTRELTFHSVIGSVQHLEAGDLGRIIATATRRIDSNDSHFSDQLRADFRLKVDPGVSVLHHLATAVLLQQILEQLQIEVKSRPKRT